MFTNGHINIAKRERGGEHDLPFSAFEGHLRTQGMFIPETPSPKRAVMIGGEIVSGKL